MTTMHHSQTAAAEKFAAMLATAAPDFATGQPYRSENGLFVLTGSPRIDREPVGLVWDNLSPLPTYVGGRETRETLEDGLVFLARQALGMYQEHGGTHHSLQKVIWSDGSWSWASVRWSTWGGESELGTVYVQGPTGSTYITARFEKERLRNPVR